MKYLVLCATLFLSFPVTASPLDDKVAALMQAMKDEVESEKGKPATSNPFILTQLSGYGAYAGELSLINSNSELPTKAEAQRTIQNILIAFTSDGVQKAGQALSVEVETERKAREDAYVAQVQSDLKHLGEVIAKGTKPSDMDSILADLHKYQNFVADQIGRDALRQTRTANMAYQFAIAWQNYLEDAASGQSEQALNDLRNLAQTDSGADIVPRSEILARIANLAKPKIAGATAKGNADETMTSAADVLSGIKNLDDMKSALKQLDAMRRSGISNGYGNAEAQNAYQVLSQLVSTYEDMKAGLPTNTPLGNYGNINGASISSELRMQMLLFQMEHYFDSYKGPLPTSNENPQVFVDQVIADAVSREDWSLLQKALTAQNYLNRGPVLGMGTNSTGVESLIGGLNQEAAGQYALAVVSYQNALKVPDSHIPAKLIGDKLAAIQKDHPKEYEDGMQMVITSPTPQYYLGTPGYPGSPVPQPSGVLSIPATTNHAAAHAPPTTNAPLPAPASTNQPPAAPAPPTTNAPPAK